MRNTTQLFATALFAACALAACVSPNAQTAPASPAHARLAVGFPIEMKAGTTAVLPDGASLRYDSIVADSRCKPDVQCVWAGDAEIRFTYQARGGQAEVFSLHTALQPRSRTLGANTLYLDAVEGWNAPVARVSLK